MERKIYQPTEKQLNLWAKYTPREIPTDEEFKALWAKRHHGKQAGWGMGKKQWIISNMTDNPEYQRGIWQGRVDRANGLDYSEERNENTYNLGYYRGYVEYESHRNGWDKLTRQSFDEKYVTNLVEA